MGNIVGSSLRNVRDERTPYPTLLKRVYRVSRRRYFLEKIITSSIPVKGKNDFRTIMDKMEIQKYTSLKAKG